MKMILVTTMISGMPLFMSRGHVTSILQFIMVLQFAKQILKIYYKSNKLMPNDGSQ